MDAEKLSERLSTNVALFEALAGGITTEQARWKPVENSWSILEVVNHLYDEERDDFRTRLDLLLHQPGQPWPDNDPSAWVIERNYNERDPETCLNNFLRERRRSLDWLAALSEPNWEAVDHRPFGEISAGSMLAAWVAHDFLHLRQLTELHWAYLARRVKPHSVAYAGPW